MSCVLQNSTAYVAVSSITFASVLLVYGVCSILFILLQSHLNRRNSSFFPRSAPLIVRLGEAS